MASFTFLDDFAPSITFKHAPKTSVVWEFPLSRGLCDEMFVAKTRASAITSGSEEVSIVLASNISNFEVSTPLT